MKTFLGLPLLTLLTVTTTADPFHWHPTRADIEKKALNFLGN
jgi:hypothetical protein